MMAQLIKNLPEYAKLLQSVGVQGDEYIRSRPLTPVQCANMIRQLMVEEGDSLYKVSERLSLGKSMGSEMYKKQDTSMVTSFLNLLKVSKKSRDLAGWGTEGFPKIPFSLISQLSTLPEKEQDMIIQSVYNTNNARRLGKDDVKRIKKWRNEHKELSIKVGIQEILKLKPVQIVNYIVVCEISPKLRQFIGRNMNHQDKIIKILRTYLDGEFYKVDTTNSLITVSMNKMAFRIFDESQRRDISFTEFLNTFLEDKIE